MFLWIKNSFSSATGYIALFILNLFPFFISSHCQFSVLFSFFFVQMVIFALLLLATCNPFAFNMCSFFISSNSSSHSDYFTYGFFGKFSFRFVIAIFLFWIRRFWMSIPSNTSDLIFVWYMLLTLAVVKKT